MSTSQQIAEITPAEFVARRARGDALTLLDVRESWELGVASVPAEQQVVHIPMGEVADRLGELDRNQEVAVLCRSGRRSLEVAKFLQQNGYRAVNVTGGILAWSRDLDATIPTY
ncbi:MAG TPA: rhodanese-like domain-containing protein [Steroidobacter sp.]|uniref:rhodanese-like domain-containing protein n=1 Tax=Steroidobacter sp. TaxID=1978227 RepID=UPI002EDAF462